MNALEWRCDRPWFCIVICNEQHQRHHSPLILAALRFGRRQQAFLSQDVLLQTKRHKITHTRAILAAQAVRDEEELARLSQKSSERARARAQKIAAGYWKVLKP